MSLPAARRALAGPQEYRRTRGGLIVAALLAPFSATQLPGPLTVGRATALAFAALLAADLLRERPRQLWPSLPAALLAAGYLGLSAWILLSSAAWGCNCDGKAGGFYEFAMIGLLAVAAIGFEPRLREPALASTLAGIVLAATLALLGVGSINSGTVDLTQTGGRLSGTFGNANELGLAAALGLPIALAYALEPLRAVRLPAVGSILLLLATLVLTYSRGAIVAAGVGSLALALWLARGSRRRLAIVLAGAGMVVLVAAALYATFDQERRVASFGSVSGSLKLLDQRDLSGWDSRPLGPIPTGPSQLSNDRASIAIRADRAGEGVSFRWGEADEGASYELRFRAKGDRSHLPFSYALGDRSQQASGPVSSGRLERRWRSFALDWMPGGRSAQATLYLWLRAGPGTATITDVRIFVEEEGAPARTITVPDRLQGSLFDRLSTRAEREEERYVQSRLDAAELAFRAFRSAPLWGIGWSTFPDYAAAHADYGELAAHNEYLAFAAELGIVGLLLLGLAIAAVVLGVRRGGSTRAETAAIGVLAAAAAGLIFVEALPVPQLSITIAIAAAVLCGRRRGPA